MKKLITFLIFSFFTTVCFAKESTLTIVNNSSYPLVKQSEQNSGMNKWNLAERIESGASSMNVVEYSSNPFKRFITDINLATTFYTVNCPNNETDTIRITVNYSPPSGLPGIFGLLDLLVSIQYHVILMNSAHCIALNLSNQITITNLTN